MEESARSWFDEGIELFDNEHVLDRREQSPRERLRNAPRGDVLEQGDAAGEAQRLDRLPRLVVGDPRRDHPELFGPVRLQDVERVALHEVTHHPERLLKGSLREVELGVDPGAGPGAAACRG